RSTRRVPAPDVAPAGGLAEGWRGDLHSRGTLDEALIGGRARRCTAPRRAAPRRTTRRGTAPHRTAPHPAPTYRRETACAGRAPPGARSMTPPILMTLHWLARPPLMTESHAVNAIVPGDPGGAGTQVAGGDSLPDSAMQ